MIINIKQTQQQVSFEQAVIQGLGNDNGLFLPSYIKPIENIQKLLDMDFVGRSCEILSHLIGSELKKNNIKQFVNKAFNFPIKLAQINSNQYCLELFHGPTHAFKDFGARFMAQCLNQFKQDQKITIITATSGDTGAAVAHAFYKLDNIEVKILYPKGKISPLQEKLFCCLGENIETFAVEGDFDDCQTMVKAAFKDQKLKQKLNLNSANSINIARLYAQVCYYFEACAQLQHNKLVVAVPSGNFGNLTAGIIAKQLGAPIKQFIAATNINDTVPRYLIDGNWSPRPTQATAANSMDVSCPNNWPRIMFLLNNDLSLIHKLVQTGVKTDQQTFDIMRQLDKTGYESEPHGAIAYGCLDDVLKEDEIGVFLGTAHPAKFMETVEQTLNKKISIPSALLANKDKTNLSISISNDTRQFINLLLK